MRNPATGQVGNQERQSYCKSPMTSVAFHANSACQNIFSAPRLQFRLREFLCPPQADRTISFNWNNFNIILERQIKHLAAHRCQMLRLRARRDSLEYSL